jgi:predicted metal-dependent hydrolase
LFHKLFYKNDTMNQIASNIAWPPDYKIKKHRLAKHVKLRTTKLHGLEITVPYRFNINNIPLILEENRDWITKHILKWQLLHQDVLPTHLCLHAIQQEWKIHYIPCDSKLELIIRPHHELVLVGPTHDNHACKQKLIRWLKDQSNLHLPAQLKVISGQTGLNYASVRIRDQQTRWGSCTSKKSISLNYKLMFLPPHLLIHVLIHELCHTKYLNHSEKFWALVARHDASWQEHKRALRAADQFVPEWLQS